MSRPTLAALAALLLLSAVPAHAQLTAGDTPSMAERARTPVEDSVLAVAKGLFNGMRTRDTALVRSSFAAGTMLGGVPPVGKPASFVPIDAFVKSIASVPAGVLVDERIYDPEIRIDGGLASVWTFYALFLGDRLSHCGVDAFHLARTSEGWKIIALADSRQLTGCDVTGKTPA